MKIDMMDTNQLPQGEELHGRGICMYAIGEPGDKHPNLRVVVEEESMPVMRQVWELGKQAELIKTVLDSMQKGEMWDFNLLWEHMLTLPGKEGEHARQMEAQGNTQ
jgi:hypothetical protein